MEPAKKYTPAEQELTFILLTELLAHQFSFPVQWIKCQDTILQDFATERLVEIGPAETLVNMAKRTLKAGYESHDVALGLQRELLTYKKNADQIYYKPSEDETPPPAPASASQPAPAQETTTPVAAAAPVAAPPAAAAAVDVPDKPVSPLDVLTVLVGVALKKPASEVAQDQSIKALCGGRSTVQNEVIGDLTKELGSLPDQPEDMPLTDLSALLSDSNLGKKLGPCTNALLGKVTTAKFPAGCNTTALRAYLDSRWGFKAGLQDTALLMTISGQPASRLSSEKEVHCFLDEIAHSVLRKMGIDPASLSSSASSSGGASASGGVAISSEQLKTLQNEARKGDQELLNLYAKRLGQTTTDSPDGDLKSAIQEMQAKLDLWNSEHGGGEVYEKGIAPLFDTKKARRYNSSWNWAVQDVVVLLSAILVGESEVDVEGKIKEGLERIPTRATTQLQGVITHLTRTLNKDVSEGAMSGVAPERKQMAREFLTDLDRAVRLALSNKSKATFKHNVVSTIPILQIDETGKVSVGEKPRMPAGMHSSFFDMSSPTSCDDISEAGEDSSSLADGDANGTPSSGQSISPSGTPSLSVFSRPLHLTGGGMTTGAATPLSSAISDSGLPPAAFSSQGNASLKWTPKLQTQSRTSLSGWRTNHDITNTYLRWFQRSSMEGLSFAGKTILVTGAGKRSIGSEIVSLCLAAGAKVLVTTSSFSKQTADYYCNLFRQFGASGAELVVVPFNGGSLADTERLVKYIYDEEQKGGLGWDLDHVVPFAAVGEAGRNVDRIDGKSELAHRVMLTNVVRLLGSIKTFKEQLGINTHPTHVLLPLSPNHGVFGGDGLYAESKMGLEAMLNKWWSEDWAEYLTMCGTIIGWTRGTGLMSGNDVLATGIEADLGIRTFSAAEMAWHVVGLMDSGIAGFCDAEPLMADLSGGLSAGQVNLKTVLGEIREKVAQRSEIQKAVWKEGRVERDEGGAVLTTSSLGLPVKDEKKRKRRAKKARIQVEKVSMPDYQDLAPLAAKLQDMIDLEQVVVVTGYGEVGPCGSARTRWEAECAGTFSIDGCVELAWIMGLIRYHKTGRLNGKEYCGWVDVKCGEPIADEEVKTKYEEWMIEHTGIRLVDHQVHDLTTPDQEQKLHEVAITEDLEPFEVSLDAANALKRQHGSNAVVTETEGGEYAVTLKAGATLWIAKATKSKSFIGAPMPMGWDPKTYGIPDDIIGQVDPVTLYALVATVECFLSAGITDPYELYKHMHVSELGNALGTSLGGLRSLHNMFKRRLLDGQVQNDILAETFVNTTAAWINMLLLGASGPIRTPVGACATSLESVDTGYDLIMNGRAKAVLVGGTDDLQRDIAHEFANMHATIDASENAAAGRTPKEASRPTTTSRAGFVEGNGCGIQLLTTAKLAVEMGLPIRGIIALSHTASDKIGRSVPSPGKGILTIATEKRSPSAPLSPLLDITHRRRQLSIRLRQIEQKRDMELAWLSSSQSSPGPSPEIHSSLLSQIQLSHQTAISLAKTQFSHNFFSHDQSISFLRGSLAIWGLTIDDLSVASLHGTSTSKNDTNETSVIQSQLVHLGRSKGNILPCVLQKSLLGHGKGAAGAFAINGALQMLETGIIPGNKNADNIDSALQDRDLLFFPSETYNCPVAKAQGGLKAFSVTSFGFGQKGAQVIGVHARYLWASLAKGEYESYKSKVGKRMVLADRALQEGIYGFGGRRFVELKSKGFYDEDKTVESLLCR
ncbi:3-oxoacyl-synthase [Rhypophila sp. PSN 637]